MKKYLILLVIFLLSCSNVFGVDYLYDDFTSKDIDKWDFHSNEGNVEIINDDIFLSSSGLSFPYFLSKDANIFPTKNNFTFDIRFKYNSYGHMGDGISIGFTGADGSFFEQFQLWNGMNHGAFLAYHDLNTSGYNLCSDLGSTNISIGITYTHLNLSNEWHVLRIERINTKYNAYIDPDINNQPIFISPDNQCAPKHILIGGIYTGGSSDWNNLTVDYIKVYSGEIETPTPTSTPTPTPRTKIIILPGLGASWNTDAIVYNKSVGSDKWKMTPFIKNYNGLINALKKNGLEQNKDFYVWNYDWRRPVSEIVTNLNGFINEKVETDEKVILIGHSLGGLVSRIWAEDNKNDSRLKEIIELSSPNLGSVDAYEVWNGGQISDLSKIDSIVFKILLKIQRSNVKTDIEAVRKYIPVVKDLLPTFNYVSKNGKIVDNTGLETNNIFLLGKNNAGMGSGINLKLFAGEGVKTADYVELKDNNIFDRILGIWPDGRINRFLYSTSGDGRILIKSASYGKDDFVGVDSNHGKIIDKTANQVMAEIGLSQVDVISESQNLSNSLVVFVGSPINYSVKCDNQSPVGDIDGFVVIKNNDYKICTINLVGTGNGLIHVVVGNTNDNDWSYWEKNIANGEVNIIKINPINGQIINNKDNVLFLKSIIKSDINSLLVLNKNNKDLREALKFLDKNQPRNLIRNIFDFRRSVDERVVSEKIIDNATIWLSLTEKCSRNEASVGFKMIDNYQNLIDKLISLNKKDFKVNENAAISYQKMDLLLNINKNKIEQKDYSEICVNNFTALNYGNEVLIKAHNKDDFKKWLLQDSNL